MLNKKPCSFTSFHMKLADTIFLSFIVLPFLFSCSNTKNLHAPAADSLPPLPESVIHVPMKIYAKPLLDKAEMLTPLQFTSEQWPGYTQYGCDFRYKYRFTRSALKFSCINNQVSISITGNYQVAGSRSACILGKQVAPWINGSCGFNNEALRKTEITITSTVRFLPNYTVRSRSAIEAIQAVDKCSVTFLNTDITPMVMNTVRSSMNTFATSLDRDIATLNIQPVIRKVEAALAKNIALGDYGYLRIRPSSVMMGKINYAKDTLYVTAGLSCYTQLISDSSVNTIRTSLPPLTNADLPAGFVVYTNVDYDYALVSRLLTKTQRNKIINIRGERVLIESIEASGLDNNTLQIKATFSGTRKGVLYLTGTPALDTNTQVISVPDLRFSLQANSFVLNAGTRFFSKKILRAIRKQAVININTLYQQHKPQLDQALTHPFTKSILSSGTTTQLSITGIQTKKQNIHFQIRLKGNISLSVNPDKLN